MNYKKAYLYLFNRLTDLILQLGSIRQDRTQINVELLLKTIQAKAEDICTEGSEAKA